jgi:D-psicose/D-tagatose/L-ribulose 3-epimerase
MLLGLNLLCVASHIDESHRPLFERVKAVGYDLVEVPVFSGQPAHYARVGAMLDEVGLARTNVAIMPSPDVDPTSADPAVAERADRHLDWVVECAAALGSRSIGGPFHAPIGHFTGAAPTPEERARVIAAHRRMAERLPDGIVLSLEPLNRFETHFLNTVDDAIAHVEAVGHPAMKLMPDTFHMNIEERDPIAATRRVAPHTGVFHVSENDRGVPGRGHIPIAAHFRALKEAGWDGIVVIEAFGDALPELAAATRVWRPLFPDIETLLTEGHDTVRDLWDRA